MSYITATARAMSENGKPETCRVVGVLKNDERLVLTTYTTADVAEKVLRLLNGGEFRQLWIEDGKPQKD